MTRPQSEPGPPYRRKVAILGGGCAGLAAAWELTNKGQREDFEVTVYQLGWRLGGKGASGRRPYAGGHRIEEHGLHLWFGFYRHAFALLKTAYAEAGLEWDQAFRPVEGVVLYGRKDGALAPDVLEFRRQSGPAFALALARVVQVVEQGSRQAFEGAPRRPSVSRHLDVLREIGAELEALAHPDEDPIELCDDWVQLGEGGEAWVVAQRGARPSLPRTRRLLRAATLRFGGLLLALRGWRISGDPARFWHQTLELAWAAFGGLLADQVLFHGLGSLDDWELREWLIHHGASERTAWESAVIRGLYDLTFAYQEGDKRKASLAAGKGLQALLLMVDYDSEFMYRMNGGMGDIVFTPLYLALRNRGVKFEFFTRIDELELEDDVVERIAFTRQATVSAGPQGYEPLVDVCGSSCWPAEPLWNQLTDAGEVRGVDFERDQRIGRRRVLVRGDRFDEVVLAMPVAALRALCPQLSESPRFKAMLDGAHTCATKALQLWLTGPAGALHEPSRRGLVPPTTGLDGPFETYCDMGQLVDVECYGTSEADIPKGIAYFCSVLADRVAANAVSAHNAVRAATVEQLSHYMDPVWPRAYGAEGLTWDKLFDPEGWPDERRLGAQYFRANLTPTERYCQTPAGSVRHRLAPFESGCANLVLAGDWTHNVIDGGCVEAAVISGTSAARALRDGLRRTPTPIAIPPRATVIPLEPYIEYGALQTAPGPLTCDQVDMWCFWLRGERDRIEQMLEQVLSNPPGMWRYRPLSVVVVLTVGVLYGLRSTHPAFADQGSLLEPEVAIWIPVVADRRNGNGWVPDHLAVFMPYVLVDEAIALTSGREVYGFPKSQGWMSSVAGTPSGSGGLQDPPTDLSVDVPGGDYGTGAQISRRRLFTITTQPVAATPTQVAGPEDLRQLAANSLSPLASSPEPAHGSLADVIRALAVTAPRIVPSIQGLLRGHITLAFHKQIRDAARGELAAVTQLVEARGRVGAGSLRVRALTRPYQVTVEMLDSHPLQRELGIGSQIAQLAFAVSFQFEIAAGHVLGER